MEMRALRSWGVVLVVLAGAAVQALAQGIQGRVLSAADSVPAAAALVQLLDANGVRVARASTSASGAFQLGAPGPGRYVVAVLRIGQRPWRSAAFDVGAGAPRRVILAVPDDPIMLEQISVEARNTCRTSPAEGTLVADLLQQVDRALTLTRMAMERQDSRRLVERYERRVTPAFQTVDSSATVDFGNAWPIRSAAPESLAVHGFVRQEDVVPGQLLGRYIYYGPDAPVLLSPWFLATHCFGVLEGSGADSGTVVVTFRPEHARRADIAGRLVLAGRTLVLRRVEWRYVGLPHWVGREGSGGAMVFERQPSGIYLPVQWWTRAPVPEVGPAPGPGGRTSVTLWGWKEGGGRLVPLP
jgi:hypothetical protein